MALFDGIYTGKKVFITGHTGFKGSWLALWLIELGAEVVGYSDTIPTTPSHYELLKLPITHIIGDILDLRKLKKTLAVAQPDIVFHLAAQPLVRASYVDPLRTLMVNVQGTATVLEACREVSSIKAIINVTTDKCYENKESDQPYTEDDPLGGYDPYSASKACSEIVTASYRNSFFNLNDYDKKHSTLLASARSGNVIGGGDWADDRIVPDIIRAITSGTKVEIRNPMATRPWQHVLEPLSGYLALGQKLLENNSDFAQAWNFGPNPASSVTVKAVAEDIKKLWSAFDYIIVTSQEKHEAQQLSLNSKKSFTKLRWDNTWDYAVCIQKTIEWYKSFVEEKKVLSREQLAEFIATAKKKKVVWTQT